VLLRRGLLAGSIVWAVALPLAAFVGSRSDMASAGYAFAISIYAAGHFVCHQIAARSFQLWGAALPVCARCTGIYVGAAAVALGTTVVPGAIRGARVPVDPVFTRRLLIAAAVPTAVTLVYEWTTGVTPGNVIRGLAGLPIGAAVMWLVATVDLER